MKQWLFVFVLLCLVLAACGRSTQTPTATPEETPLFTDADIDNAVLQLPISTTDLIGLEEVESPEGEGLPDLLDSESALSPRVVLPGTSGFIYYVSSIFDFGTGGLVSSLYRHDQGTDTYTLVYSGDRYIQSVAGSSNGNFIVVSMRQTTDPNSQFDIYFLNVTDLANPAVFRRTFDTVDNTNVSMSRNFERYTYEESVSGKAVVVIAENDEFFNPTLTTLSNARPQRQPSLSGDGRHLALVRDLADGRDQVLSYDVEQNRYSAIVTSSATLEYPSISDNGLKILWVQNGSTDQIRLENRLANTMQTVVSGLSLTHPHLTSEGDFIAYQSGGTIVTKDLRSGGVQTTAGGQLFTYTAPMWQRVAPHKLVGQGGSDFEFFGGSVAISGNLMVVGAQSIFNNAVGAAYLYERDSLGGWNFVKKLLPNDGRQGDGFGYSVAISGTTVVIGAPYESHDTNEDNIDEPAVGAAYIFQKDQGGSNTWGQVKKLLGTSEQFDNFGYSVSISGNLVVAGAFHESHDTNGDGAEESQAGATYIFQRDRGGTNNWGQVKRLIANDDAAFDQFGVSVSMSGTTLVVGAWAEDHDTDGNGTVEGAAGAAYIFSRDQGGANNWGQVKKLVAGDDAANEAFGWSASITGNTVVVGAKWEDHNTDGNGSEETEVGAVYIFQKDQGGINRWGQVKKLVATDDSASDEFGSSVSISGNTVVIGAPSEAHDIDGNGTDEFGVGAAYVFRKDQGGTNTWGQVSKLTAGDAVADDHFGAAVSVSGNSVIVGAPERDDGSGFYGAAYFYQ
jgi:FG-GAP repeat